MLKKKVIASSITNLTDVRYFAGWMIDIIIFNIDPSSSNYVEPQEIGGFQSWVEGPKFYLELNEEQLQDAEKYLVQLNSHGLYIPWEWRSKVAMLDIPLLFYVDFNEWKSLATEMNEEDVVIQEVPSLLKGIEAELNSKGRDTYLEITDQEISEEEILHPSINGFLIHGSPEEKVGYKDYEELDQFFEILQDF